MGKYIGPKCRLSRREGVDLLLKSSVKSFDNKCKSDKAPGQHGGRPVRKTDYNNQLRMKQRIKRYYGVRERQFINYYKIAASQKGATGENLIRLLESRLDNLVYHMGFGATRAEARQLVNHKTILVNGKMVNIPSYLVKLNDEISVKPKSQKQARISSSLELASHKIAPEWISVNTKEMSGTFTRYPDANEIPNEFEVHLVVELYSK